MVVLIHDIYTTYYVYDRISTQSNSHQTCMNKEKPHAPSAGRLDWMQMHYAPRGAKHYSLWRLESVAAETVC